MRKSIAVLAGLIAIGGALPAATAAVIEVFPVNDPAVDRAALSAAIAAAAPGDTILLRAGVFDLTPPERDPTDCSLDVAVPLPDGDDFRFWDAFAQTPDPCNPGAPDVFDFGERNSVELYLIDKPLTIEGEAGAGGPRTTLRVQERFFDVYVRVLAETGSPFAAFGAALEADAFFLVVGAADVTIRDIEFDGPVFDVITFWAGTDVAGCTFRAVGFGPYYFPDERSIYSQLPGFDEPTQSAFSDNVFIDAEQGIHIGGSEVRVSGNTFDHYLAYGVYVSAYATMTLPVSEGGEGLPLVRSVAQNNRIEGNTFINGSSGFPRLALDSLWGGPVRDNKVVGNSFTGHTTGVLLNGRNRWAVQGTVVADHAIEGNEIDVSGWGIAVWGARGTKITANRIEGAAIGVWSDWNATVASSNPTAPSVFMVPATLGLIRDNLIVGTDVGVRLGASARDNLVKQNDVRDSLTADYLLNAAEAPFGPPLDMLTFGPANGNVLEVAAGSIVLDLSGCTNTDACDPYDDDDDGSIDEDPTDGTNNDLDTVLGFFSLIDEDPAETPNHIREK